MNIESLIEVKPNPNIPALAPGDTVKVRTRIVEGDKERSQIFQGIVIRLRRGGINSSFTVRHVAYGVGVERTFPFHSPLVEGVEVVRHGKVRRAKLYYLRGLSGKASRIKERRVERGEAIQEEPGEEPPALEQTDEAPVLEQPGEQPVAQEQPGQPDTQPAEPVNQLQPAQEQPGQAAPPEEGQAPKA